MSKNKEKNVQTAPKLGVHVFLYILGKINNLSDYITLTTLNKL